MKNIKILFVPDVHGRYFWKKPVMSTLRENPDAKIVFLGDYLDPYKHEWEYGEPIRGIAIDVFKDIVNLKKEHPDNIILLIGNHDSGYALGEDYCQSRRDYFNAEVIGKYFNDNHELFQIAYDETINDIHYVFSHAGISTNFMNFYYGEELEKDKIVDFLNNIWLAKDWQNLTKLSVYDRFRGYLGEEWASPIWADIRQMCKLTKENSIGDFQIVGHTQISGDKPLIFDCIGDFDCRRCFYIDDKGVIRDYETDNECEKTVG